MLFIIIITIVIIIFIYALSVQRKLVVSSENIDNAFSQIGVNQQSRWDALTQLAKATSSYSAHEYKTLMDVIEKRQQPKNIEDLEKNEESIQKALARINIVAEQYPDLKASLVYQETMKSINEYENKVRVSRMVYNDTVTIFNRIVKQIPSSIFASIFGFSGKNYLKNNDEKSEMPDLQF